MPLFFWWNVRSKFHHQLSNTFFSHNCSRRQPAVTTAATKPHHSVGPLGRLGRATLEKAGAGQSTNVEWQPCGHMLPPLRFFGPSCDHNFRNARNTSDPHYAEVVPSVSLRSCVGCYSICLLIVSPSILESLELCVEFNSRCWFRYNWCHVQLELGTCFR